MKYVAISLQEIVAHFENLANAHADQCVNAKTAKAKQSHKAQAATWSAAAHFLEHCELKA